MHNVLLLYDSMCIFSDVYIRSCPVELASRVVHCMHIVLTLSSPQGFLGSPRIETREQAAHLLGRLSSSLSEVEYSSLLNQLLQDMDSSKVGLCLGSCG